MTERLRGLYAITDPLLCEPDLIDKIVAAIAGGARLVQYRHKSAPTELALQQAGALAQLCRQHGVLFIVNDDVELALAVDADGVHLGQQDSDPVAARRRLGEHKIIGVSCNNRLDLAIAAQQAGADYIAFGRFFASQTKPQAPGAELSLLREARQQLRLPIVAIGGVTPDNACRLLANGADMLAVIHGLFGQADIQAAAQELSRCFD